MARLAGKVALITGAGSGIGRVAAQLFAREGASIAIADISVAGAEQTAQLVVQAGGRALPLPTDVTEPESVQAAVRRTVQEFGALHVVMNNAGGSTPGDNTAVDVDLDEFWRVIRLNLYGAFLGCRYGIPELVRAGGGSVINMTSSAALMGVPGRDSYAAAKGGVIGMTRGLAVAYAKHKVRVNALAASATRTPRVQALLEQHPEMKRIADSQPLGLLEPEDVAYAALYLASDESRGTTGSVQVVDAGVTIA